MALCGSLSILVLPLLGHALKLDDQTFGTWVGAGVHDVGQVTATASAYSEAALVPATLVKLTRVILLAPMVFGVGPRRVAALRCVRRRPVAKAQRRRRSTCRSCRCSSRASSPPSR